MFLNDTSAYHGGSWAATMYLKSQPLCDREDTLVVNGEGTLHHGRGEHLCDAIEKAQAEGKYTYLVNTTWQDMPLQRKTMLQRLTRVSVRETRSQQEMQKWGIEPEVHLDAAYFHPTSWRSYGREGTLVTDAYSHGWYWPPGETRRLDMLSLKWQDVLQTVALHELLITGRFHGIIAALKTRTPFMAMPGNSHKTVGLLEMLDAKELMATRPVDFDYESLWERVEGLEGLTL